MKNSMYIEPRGSLIQQSIINVLNANGETIATLEEELEKIKNELSELKSSSTEE